MNEFTKSIIISVLTSSSTILVAQQYVGPNCDEPEEICYHGYEYSTNPDHAVNVEKTKKNK